ncbi:MAG TPA: hypothetical protein PKL92_09080 [Aquaticitalea sp.]|nr:hypothetical protein [Aquaticitalea sp.]HNU58592.1 hypothetical protein [Aquaticitalea sp.]
MYSTIKILHSYWAYLVILILALAALNALVKYFANKEFHAKDFRISLFALIVTHIQLILGLILYFVSPLGLNNINADTMGNSFSRLLAVEHPLMGLVAVTLITIGYSKHKKKLISKPKFKVIAIFYTIALVLVLSRIPWTVWPAA